MPLKICKDGRIWGQNNKEASSHLGIKTGRKYSYIHTPGCHKGNPHPISGVATRFKRGQTLGEKPWNWKGGIYPLIRAIRTCDEYKKWRYQVFKRDNLSAARLVGN